MLLDTIILVLRETLEAGVLISVLLCVANQNRFGLSWLWTGLTIGCLVALAYASNFSLVSQWFDYAGQEVVNSSMQFGICFSLLFICLRLIYSSNSSSANSRATIRNSNVIKLVMTTIVVLVIARELTEMIIFYTGFFQSDGELVNALTSGFVGLMIGISVGVICFYIVDSWNAVISKNIQIATLTLIAAGMVVQAAQLLIQVDWISSTGAFWDTNWLLTESSTIGQMAYAIFGYESTPSLTEVGLYNAVIFFIIMALLIKFYTGTNKRTT